MPKLALKVSKHKNTLENWYHATGLIEGRMVQGYGTSFFKAIADACRDWEVIKNLSLKKTSWTK